MHSARDNSPFFPSFRRNLIHLFQIRLRSNYQNSVREEHLMYQKTFFSFLF